MFKFWGGKKQLERQTMQYWEDTSYMLGLVHPKCDYILDENVFERIRNIEDVTLQARSLPSEENPGRLLISYHGEEYELEFEYGEYEAKDLLNVCTLQFFTKEEMALLEQSKYALTTAMKFGKKFEDAYQLQVKILYTMIGLESIAIYDESAEYIMNRRWAEIFIQSEVGALYNNLYHVQAVVKGDKLWLHTHGLSRCGVDELEILNVNKKDYSAYYSLLTVYASHKLDGNTENTIYIGVDTNGKEIVVRALPWTEALNYYPKNVLGGIADRQESHNTQSRVLFFVDEENEEEQELHHVSENIDELEKDVLYYWSNELTEKTYKLARERFSYVIRALKEGIEVRIKVLFRGESQEEIVWVKAERFLEKEQTIVGTLANHLFFSREFDMGDEMICPIKSLVDWTICLDKFYIHPDSAYILDLYRNT